MTYRITPEGRSQPGDEFGILDLVKEGPVDEAEIVRASGQSAETVKQYLGYYVRNGFMTMSQEPSTTQPSSPGFTLGGLEKEAGDADAEMGRNIAGIM